MTRIHGYIDIPNRRPKRPEELAAEQMRSLGMDPRKGYANTMATEVALRWTRGDMSDAQFENCIRKLLIINPGLKAKG